MLAYGFGSNPKRSLAVLRTAFASAVSAGFPVAPFPLIETSQRQLGRRVHRAPQYHRVAQSFPSDAIEAGYPAVFVFERFVGLKADMRARFHTSERARRLAAGVWSLSEGFECTGRRTIGINNYQQCGGTSRFRSWRSSAERLSVSNVRERRKAPDFAR